MLPLISTSFEITRVSTLVYAYSDLSPPGAPDKLIDPNEYLTANPTLLDQVTATSPTMFHGNAYPVGASDVYTFPGATVTNNPNLTNPEDASNTSWHIASS